MTPITDYFLTRLDDTGNTQVEILDNSAFVAYQVYVDNAKVKESTSLTFNAVIRKNKKVDIIGLDSGEQGQNFSNSGTIGDDYGDKVEFILPYSFLGRAVKIYSDHQTGTLDFGRPIAYGIADEVVRTDLGWHDFTADEWANFTADQWNEFEADGGEQWVKVTITRRLRIGEWKFALVDFNEVDVHRNPYIFTKSIQTRPDEIAPFIVSYDSATDELLIGADDAGTGATYHLYASPWGQGKTEINFASPVLASTVVPISALNLRVAQHDNTRWLAVRKEIDGVEEQNFNVFPFVLIGNEWAGSFPEAPERLRGEIREGNTVRLTWRYQVNAAVPTGFHIYAGETVIDYDDAIATVPYVGNGSLSAILPEITATTKFAVRAFHSTAEDTNTDFVSVSPLEDLVQVTGEGEATWSEE